MDPLCYNNVNLKSTLDPLCYNNAQTTPIFFTCIDTKVKMVICSKWEFLPNVTSMCFRCRKFSKFASHFHFDWLFIKLLLNLNLSIDSTTYYSNLVGMSTNKLSKVPEKEAESPSCLKKMLTAEYSWKDKVGKSWSSTSVNHWIS